MMTSKKSHLLALSALSLLAACGSEPEPAAEQPGALAVANKNAPLPGGFTPYPGARQLSRTSIEQNGQSYTLLSMQVDVAPEVILAHYRQQAEAAGIPISLEMSANGQHQIGGESRNGLNFSLTARGAGAGTSATLAIGQVPPE